MQNDDFGYSQSSQPTAQRTGQGGWHWLLSIVAILIVGLFAFGMSFLTKHVEERPVWMMGLIFMIPTAALMIAAMLVEGATSAMTPSSSRGPQLKLAIIATVATFLVGYICDLIYLQSFKKELPPAQSRYELNQTADRAVWVMDGTQSMQEGEGHGQALAAVQKLTEAADPAWEIGMVYSGAARTETVSIHGMDDAQKTRLLNLAQTAPNQGRMYYQSALSKALDLAEAAGVQAESSFRIILFTDGGHAWAENENVQDLFTRCVQDNAVVSCVLLGSGIDETLKQLILRTGGAITDAAGAAGLMDSMYSRLVLETVKAAEIPENEKLAQDLLRNDDPAAKIITLVMLVLEGLSLGVCLSLMLSVSGQFRVQYLISPIMGFLAYMLLKEVFNYQQDWSTWWIKEGLSFSLLGVVFMMRNHAPASSRRSGSAAQASGPSTDDFGF